MDGFGMIVGRYDESHFANRWKLGHSGLLVPIRETPHDSRLRWIQKRGPSVGRAASCGTQAARTLVARGPLGLASTSNSTRSPPMRRSKLSEESSPSRWKKYSFASSAAMKPKPRSETTFLMVPVAMMTSNIPRTRICTAHGPFEKRGDHATLRHTVRRTTTLAQGSIRGLTNEPRRGVMSILPALSRYSFLALRMRLADRHNGGTTTLVVRG